MEKQLYCPIKSVMFFSEVYDDDGGVVPKWNKTNEQNLAVNCVVNLW